MSKISAAPCETIYIADVMACNVVDGCLSKNDAYLLFRKHGSAYEEFVKRYGEVLDAKSILEWLGY
ncbi:MULTISPECIES: hypothetical protein [Prochlorococcus]|uniref:hypothetical protein n=1 Tax=Prochlorococcus TaxID=1218 RepID=UPI0005339E2D|nr:MULTISPECIES: hypothetical protein [Prochlorococcus]KGG12539.1 hypothetical protein EV05_1751 [Prochlorococcus sp. MIT 0601]